MADIKGLKENYTGNTPETIGQGASNTANIGNTQIGDMQHNIMWSPQWIQDKWKNAGKDSETGELNKGKRFGDRAGLIAAVLGNAIASTPIHWGGMASGGNPENDLIRKGIEQSNEDYRKVGQEAAEGGMNAMQASNEQARQNAEMINTADLMKQIGSLSEADKAAIMSGKNLTGNSSIQAQLISDLFNQFMSWMDKNKNNGEPTAETNNGAPTTIDSETKETVSPINQSKEEQAKNNQPAISSSPIMSVEQYAAENSANYRDLAKKAGALKSESALRKYLDKQLVNQFPDKKERQAYVDGLVNNISLQKK